MFPVAGGVDHAAIKHFFEEDVAAVVMSLSDLKRPGFLLRIPQQRLDVQPDAAPTGQRAALQVGATNVIKELIEGRRIPPAVHVRFAKSQGAVAENARIEFVTMNDDVPG